MKTVDGNNRSNQEKRRLRPPPKRGSHFSASSNYKLAFEKNDIQVTHTPMGESLAVLGIIFLPRARGTVNVRRARELPIYYHPSSKMVAAASRAVSALRSRKCSTTSFILLLLRAEPSTGLGVKSVQVNLQLVPTDQVEGALTSERGE